MSGIDHQVLRFGEPPIWATDGDQALGPADSGGPSYATMHAGWQVGQRPPARWMNWVLRQLSVAMRAVIGGALASWREALGAAQPAVHTGDVLIVHHPAPGDGTPGTLAIYSTSGVVRSIDGGENWISSGSTPSTTIIYPNAAAIDQTNVLVGLDGDVYFKNSVATWSTAPSSENVGFGATIDVTALVTTYRTGGNFAIAGASDGQIAYRANGVGGAGGWALSSVDPNSLGDTSAVTALCYIEASTYLALTADGFVYRTTNSGFSWALYATLPSVDSDCEHMVRCPDTGVLVVTQADTTTPAILYSDNNGLTWTAATLENFTTSGSWAHLKTVGGGAFVAAKATNSGIWRSIDRGRTWRKCWLEVDAVFAYNVRGFGCDGTRVTALARDSFGGDGHTFLTRSLDYAGDPEPS